MNKIHILYLFSIVSMPVTLIGCNGKKPIELTTNQSSDSQPENSSNQKYEEYTELIVSAPTAGMQISKIQMQGETFDYVSSSDMAENQRYINELGLKIKADQSLSGTETTGDKGKLLAELNSPRTLDFLGTIKKVNYPLIQATYNQLAIKGYDGLKIPDISSNVLKVAGSDSYIKLSSSPNEFAQNLRNIFLPLGVKTDGGGIPSGRM